jgi:hypothetical protein
MKNFYHLFLATENSQLLFTDVNQLVSNTQIDRFFRELLEHIKVEPPKEVVDKILQKISELDEEDIKRV